MAGIVNKVYLSTLMAQTAKKSIRDTNKLFSDDVYSYSTLQHKRLLLTMTSHPPLFERVERVFAFFASYTITFLPFLMILFKLKSTNYRISYFLQTSALSLFISFTQETLHWQYCFCDQSIYQYINVIMLARVAPNIRGTTHDNNIY